MHVSIFYCRDQYPRTYTYIYEYERNQLETHLERKHRTVKFISSKWQGKSPSNKKRKISMRNNNHICQPAVVNGGTTLCQPGRVLANVSAEDRGSDSQLVEDNCTECTDPEHKVAKYPPPVLEPISIRKVVCLDTRCIVWMISERSDLRTPAAIANNTRFSAQGFGEKKFVFGTFGRNCWRTTAKVYRCGLKVNCGP